ncbi:hypothetical protein [Pectinatus frisingensis]|jgi:hypothetical protein|uniref:hypothetical protein n=1 Tax=Pectinatus frisingensis TaxID=865 RepID=UPI0015F37E3A|nr:hypothetical protein [Pectinatus frisingensis]
MNNKFIEPAYGKDQNIKMDIMKMINEGKNPYEIIYYIVDYLEKVSGEKGYAANVRECIDSIYGIGLGAKQPLTDELFAVQQRCHKMEEALNDIDDEDVKKRIGFAIGQHKKFAAFLEEKIKKAKK